jgi:acetoin utilization protein AcuB
LFHTVLIEASQTVWGVFFAARFDRCGNALVTRLGQASGNPTRRCAMTVRQYMTPNPILISPETTVPEAVSLMRQHGFRRLPVVKASELIGIVTDRDLKEAMPSDATSLSIWEINFLIAKLRVSEIMKHPVYTVSEDAPLETAARLMLEKSISGLPVMFDDRITGIITVTDVLRAYLDQSGRVARPRTSF